jgi:CHASE2 domain-containing sensor protein
VNKLVALKIGKGGFEQGFPIILQIGEDGKPPDVELPGKLPPAPDLPPHYRRWQTAYHQLREQWRIEFPENEITHISSKADCKQAAERLKTCFNNWLESPQICEIRECLFVKLSPDDAIRIIICTEDPQLRRLPWHLWRFLKRYPQAEIGLGATSGEKVHPAPVNQTVDILAILGSSAGINVQRDRSLLEQLPNAKTQLLVEPERQVLGDQLWDQSWDILFFAGHSSTVGSEEIGQLAINSNDYLELSELKHALQVAIRKGLKLAIFNSCDGLGLARQLEDLNFPQLIVMREPVPDLVAQEFLKYFLKAYSAGASLYLAVREARERLEGLEDYFPCASWLPVICQNFTEVPPTWHMLKAAAPSRPWAGIKTALICSLVAAGFVSGIRWLGLLQAFELQTFDHFMRLRPEEPPDSRLLIVTVTEEDIQAQGKEPRKGTLADKTLLRLLDKLDRYQPAVIGLDIYRDFSTENKQLSDRLRQSPHLITICKASAPVVGVPAIVPPPEIAPEQFGFSDFVLDSDGILRRQILTMEPNPDSACSASDAFDAFSTKLALGYLSTHDIQPIASPEGNLQIGSVVFKPLSTFKSAYQKADLAGHQILLNYRSHEFSSNIFPQVTLTQVLNNEINPALIKDRIVLIGVTTYSIGDFWSTPFSQRQTLHQQAPGVFIHAHMVSQIISSVLDQRPLIRVWPSWSEWLWIWSWAMLGCITVLWARSPFRLIIAIIMVSTTLWGSCLIFFSWGSWVPFVPPLLATGLSTTATLGCLSKKHDSNQP